MNLARHCREVADEAQEKSDTYARRSYYAADIYHYVTLAHEFGVIAAKMRIIADVLESEQTNERKEQLV